jgi:ATP-dependent DNA helicase DinG
MELDVNSILGPEGRIAARLKSYESRPQQLSMAQAVEQAIAEQSHLIVEAGTGVGKSFAYLVPAILHATKSQRESEKSGSGGNSDGGPVSGGEDKKKRSRVVVSTHTISLQEQLANRDIPFLNSVLPVEFSSVLVKGRSNYVSLRRLKNARDRANSLFSDPQELKQLDTMLDWATDTRDGSRASLDFRPMPTIWDEIQSEHGNCLGRQCDTYDDCHYFKARRRIWNADILVVNHALFFSDLALRREGVSLLPDYDVAVLDEAHTIEGVAGDHMGISVSSGQVEYLLARLYNDRTQKGVLVSHRLVECQKLVQRLRMMADDFFASLQFWRQDRCPKNGRVTQKVPMQNELTPALTKLGAMIGEAAEDLDDEVKESREAKVELNAAAERCKILATSVNSWMQQTSEEDVYWIESTSGRRENVKLTSSPVEVGPALRDSLFANTPSVILASATLAVGHENFDFLKTRIGVSKSNELMLGSPFDYRRQAKLILQERMPDPGSQGPQFEDAVCEGIKKYVAQTNGRAFVLFTSYWMLKNCARKLGAWFAQQNLALYCQGDGLPRTLMLDRFKKDPAAVLFGADSFWQGVDVPGEALQNVIITKLPFSVPDHPLLEARLEAIRARNGNPFMEYQVPEAVIRLKQGFGRLIRSQSDTGQVVILDPRIRTKPYGKLFIESLPECNLIIDPGFG